MSQPTSQTSGAAHVAPGGGAAGATAAPSAEAAEARRVAQEKALYQQQRAANRRKHQRAGGRDMVISMAVLLVPIIAIVWFFQQTPSRPPVTAVDVTSATAGARSQAKFPVYVPVNLPSGWTPVRATWVPAGGTVTGHGSVTSPTWVVGYQGSDDMYYEVDEQGPASASFVSDYTKAAPCDGTATVNGQRFQTCTSDDGSMHYLVRTASGWTMVVAGAASLDRLEAFTGTLSATAKP